MTATARSRHANAGLRPAGALLAVLLAASLPLAAPAKQSDRDQPMNYTSKYTEAFNAPNTVSTLKGNVRITQGTLLLTGGEAKIHLNGDSEIARVVVTGAPAHIQQMDDSNNLMQGDAATLDYDNLKGIAVLTGNAVVKQQGRGEFHGDKLTYNTQTSQITGESNGDGLVHGTFLPKKKPAAPTGNQP
ncbi:sugar transporter [Frateuria sp. Soil773]|uniref:lipopolysaccharide transport periplasmic protein LptA n=1 Tax=Frateuria sp. Soil773 TaxID=1736407 RepID=UPI0006F361CC|nr:lipopolysaccharide transport periplasmic protein LptA [Frateuria sp. Soil773]KRE90777.1 sugar transporter [Frateuria sp. Soil773]